LPPTAEVTAEVPRSLLSGTLPSHGASAVAGARVSDSESESDRRRVFSIQYSVLGLSNKRRRDFVIFSVRRAVELLEPLKVPGLEIFIS